MIRSMLAGLLKQDMGLVRRRTSRKARSMGLVVQILARCGSGRSKQASNASMSRVRQATALGSMASQRTFQALERRTAWRRVRAL